MHLRRGTKERESFALLLFLSVQSEGEMPRGCEQGSSPATAANPSTPNTCCVHIAVALRHHYSFLIFSVKKWKRGGERVACHPDLLALPELSAETLTPPKWGAGGGVATTGAH